MSHKDFNRLARPLIVLAMVLGFFMGRASAATPTLSEIASGMAGETVTVHCVNLRGRNEYGFTNEIIDNGKVSFEPDEFLSIGTCVGVQRLYEHRIYSLKFQSNALETMLHESYHIRLNSGNEGKVECTAMKNLWPYIVALGFSHAIDKRMLAVAWQEHWKLPPNYLVGCPQNPVLNLQHPKPMAKG